MSEERTGAVQRPGSLREWLWCVTFGLAQSGLGNTSEIDTERGIATTTAIKQPCSVHSLSAKDANTIKRAHESDEPFKIL
jgi:hypothetical protein